MTDTSRARALGSALRNMHSSDVRSPHRFDAATALHDLADQVDEAERLLQHVRVRGLLHPLDSCDSCRRIEARGIYS